MGGAILIVDPDAKRRASLRLAFAAAGVEVLGTDDPTQAASFFREAEIDAVLFTIGTRRLALQRLFAEARRYQPLVQLVGFLTDPDSATRLAGLGLPACLSVSSELDPDDIASQILDALAAAAPPVSPPPLSIIPKPSSAPPPLPSNGAAAAPAPPAVARYEPYESVVRTEHWLTDLCRSPSGYEPALVTRATGPAALDPEFRKAFIAAARGAEGVSAPRVAAVREVGGEDDLPFVAAAACPGRTLRDLLHQLHAGGRTMPAQVSAFVIHEAAGAVGALHRGHRHPILHGAVSPSAIWLGLDGRVLVYGAGILRFLQYYERTGRVAPATATAPTRPVGEPQAGGVLDAYVAPEDLRGVRLDPRTDVYLLGVVLYELLSGQPLFPGKAGRELAQAIRENEPDPAPLAALPKELQTLIVDCLDKNPERRPGDAGSLRELIAPYQTPLPQAQGGLIGRLFAKRDSQPSAPASSPEDELIALLRG
jgi:serine/threonine protein kinase